MANSKSEIRNPKSEHASLGFRISDFGFRQRRQFLADLGMGFTGLVLGTMLYEDGLLQAVASSAERPCGLPPRVPKAKHVIWLFMMGGVSHLESFDPKPALNKYADKTISAT